MDLHADHVCLSSCLVKLKSCISQHHRSISPVVTIGNDPQQGQRKTMTMHFHLFLTVTLTWPT